MAFDFQTAFYHKLDQDSAFIVSDVSNVASGGTFNVHLKNPSGSSKTLYLVDIRTTSDGSYIARVHDAFSSTPSGGTAVDIQAMLLDKDNIDNDGVATANTDVSFTATSTHAVGVSGGGGDGASVGGTSQHAAMAIEPGREIVIEVENTSASGNNYAVSIVYFEKDNGAV